MKRVLPLLLALAWGHAALAADLPVKATPLFVSSGCVAQNCSGWYAGFGIMGDGTNVDIVGVGINQSVFSEGGILKIQGGYQLWNGAWFAAIDGSVGYEFTNPAAPNLGGSKFVGTELVKLGYNFFPTAQTGTTSPSQSPIPLTVPANLLAASTPYLTFGGMQRRGMTEWVNGAGIQTVIAAGWSTDVKYLYAPSQQGQPASNVVILELNKHF